MAWSDPQLIRDIIFVLANTEEIVGEFIALVQYAIQFISISTLDYHAVRWRLFHAPITSEWSNVLILAKILFSVLSSNGKLERVFHSSTS